MSKQVSLKVTGMTCNNCRRHVTEALEKVPGVSAVDVDLSAGSAEVTADDQLDVTKLIDAVEEEGYSAAVS